jgi:peroxiredoxin
MERTRSHRPSPTEKPDETLATAEKNSLKFEALSDVGQKVGRAFGLVYVFTGELKRAYEGFGLDIPAKNGTNEWSLPISATYAIAKNGRVVYAYTDPDYRDRADPEEAVRSLKEATVAA